MTVRLRFQGGAQFTTIPEKAGLYAWYYRPRVIDPERTARILASVLSSAPEMETRIKLRYNMQWALNASLAPRYGTAGSSTVEEILASAISRAGDVFRELFQGDVVVHFTRPLYIGIAQNLRTRIFDQHYRQLEEMWREESSVSRFLGRRESAAVQDVIDSLGLPHSFALEARVHGIPVRDLSVQIFPTELPVGIGPDVDDNSQAPEVRRAVEQLLQLMSDPILGRR